MINHVYVIKTRVTKVEKKSRALRSRKVGDEIVTEREELGWFVLFYGSREMVFLGNEKPELSDGDSVKITIERL